MEKSNQMQKIKDYFRQELRESFNESKFNENIKSGKEISWDKIDEYKKREKKLEPQEKDNKNKDGNTNKISNGNGLSFVASFKNGEWVGVGSNGHVIKSKNMDDFHRQLAKVFKLNALKNGKEPACSIRIGEKMADKEKIAESFARNFINEGVVVKGDLPQSPEFWNKLKADYLAQKGHNLKMWNKLTRFVPAEYMRPVANAKITQENIQKINTPKQKAPSPATLRSAQARSGR